ncbi:hypothetical protein DBV39_01220 [Orrella marina]|uniref:Uncharacterized protein n=1 Tax=Orrella marina TaxID=2163011 RepID=A0A2R4XFI2_9BURK|nr:hypothetical protein DBV39_01220 [Orrella marina]
MKSDARLIEESGFFDAEWYCNQYPDVRQISLDPATHFLKYGWRLKRNPSVKFQSSAYLERYPDVQSAGINPLLHFLEKGKNEGRSAPPVPVSADSRYSPDLNEASLAIAKGLESEGKEDRQTPTAEEQLAETQRLLEHYFVQYETLRFAMLDQNKNNQTTNPSP